MKIKFINDSTEYMVEPEVRENIGISLMKNEELLDSNYYNVSIKLFNSNKEEYEQLSRIFDTKNVKVVIEDDINIIFNVKFFINRINLQYEYMTKDTIIEFVAEEITE